jgi:hypothetical protein
MSSTKKMSEHPSPPYNLPDTGEAVTAVEAAEVAEVVIEAAEVAEVAAGVAEGA